MPRRARIHYVSLRSSLVNLPISIYGPLLERSIRPQNLAIHLTLVSSNQNQSDVKLEAYVGWTGMASASSLAHFNSSDRGEKGFETIEIDPQYAQGLGLAKGDLVEIGLLHDLPLAKFVGTEPLTSDDWEVIEIHASHVESTLLSQVRVAKIGQEIDVWVLGRTRVRLRVVTLNPQSKGNALLLTTNSEVSIAPKLHPSHLSASASGKIRVQINATPPGITNGIAKANPKPKTKNYPQILRVLPPRVLRPPISTAFAEHAGPELLAYVSLSTFVQLHPTIPPPSDPHTNNKNMYLKTILKHLRPPSDPSSSPSSTPAPVPIPRILNPGSNDKDKEASGSSRVEGSEVFVNWLEGIPESHVVFPTMVEGVNEWDLVRLSPAADSSAIHVPQELVNSSTTTAMITHPSSSSTPFLAGVNDILTQCTKFCMTKLSIHASTSNVHGVSALVVTGRPGAGKTSIVQAVAKILQEDPKTFTYTYYVDVSRYSEQPISAVKGLFRYWFDKAAWHRPSILILDNLEKLLGAEVEHADSFRTRHITEIFLSLYSSSARTAAPNSRGIILLGTAPSTAALHPLISSAHIFSDVVHVNAPNKDARRDIIARIVQGLLDVAQNLHQDPESPLNYTALATQTEGYSATDLQDLVARAVHQVAIRSSDDNGPTVLTSADFKAAQVDFVPLSLRDIKLQKSEVAWSDIGGLHETRRILRETLEWPTKYGPIFAQSPLRLRSGLLLYGFPGCGKTLLASAVAKECGLNFISVKGPEILNKYIGASEKSVRDLFERASAAKPCVLFFDEFDSIAPKRGHDSTGVTDRVVNQMLTQMDGAEGLDGVYVLAATSRPDLIDSALLRPGRLDKSLFCSMPNVEERKDILTAVGRKVSIASSVQLDEVAEATEGYSGADLQALLYNAHLEVVHASIAGIQTADQSASRAEETLVEYTTLGDPAEKSVTSKAEEIALQRRLRQIKSVSKAARITPKASPAVPKKREITEEHIRRVLQSTRPSVSPEERERLGRIYRAFVSGRSGNLPIPPDAGGVGNRASLM